MSTQSLRKSPYTLFVATGLMLFALFFGAGNLIFPAHMGQQAGDNYIGAVLGFVLTGAGLPLLGILAMAYSGHVMCSIWPHASPHGLGCFLPWLCICQLVLYSLCLGQARWLLKWGLSPF